MILSIDIVKELTDICHTIGKHSSKPEIPEIVLNSIITSRYLWLTHIIISKFFLRLEDNPGMSGVMTFFIQFYKGLCWSKV